MGTDQVDPTALRVMHQQAVSEAQDCVDQGVRFQYQEIAEASVRKYVDACRVPFPLTPSLRSQYEDEVRRHLLAEGSRRGWPVN